MSASQPVFRFRAFLCYSHRDSAWADWLHHTLESFPIPARLVGLETGAGVIPKKLAPVFRDRDELPSATNLSAKVSDALAQSANLVVICSPHAAQSPWVDEEVRTFQRLGRSDRIFCLIVDGEPGASQWAGREHDECIPSALTHRFDAAGNETDERLDPIAADARPGMDGKANARTKLVAGLLGVDLDDLRQRERRRRRWNAAAAIALGVALLCLTTALAVNAVIARHAAERRQKQAEELVAFMLGDLDDKLREVNRLDILESVANKAVEYFDALPVADTSDDALSQRIKALLKVGRLRFEQGRIAEAETTLNKAAEASTSLMARAPGNATFAEGLAQARSWQGRIEWTRGNLDPALKKFREAAELLDEPVRNGLKDSDAVDLLASVRTNIGRVLEARGDLAGARAEYERVLQIYERLAVSEPQRSSWKTELAYAHNNLGQLAWNEGDLARAIEEYAADQRIKSSLSTLAPQDNSRREDLLISNAILGNALLSVGELDLSRAYLQRATSDASKLVTVDATVTGWQEDAAYYDAMLASALRARGDFEGSQRLAEGAVARMSALVARDPANLQWLRELAECEIEEARAMLARSRASEANDTISRAVVRARALRSKDATGLRVARTLVEAQLLAGDIASTRGKVDEASSHWLAAQQILNAHGVEVSPPWVALRVSAKLRLGDGASVAPMIEHLASIGYRKPDFIADLTSHGLPYASANSESSVRDAVASIRAADPGHSLE